MYIGALACKTKCLFQMKQIFFRFGYFVTIESTFIFMLQCCLLLLLVSLFSLSNVFLKIFYFADLYFVSFLFRFIVGDVFQVYCLVCLSSCLSSFLKVCKFSNKFVVLEFKPKEDNIFELKVQFSSV